MTITTRLAAIVLALAFALPAAAHPGKGKGNGNGNGAWKQDIRTGNCRIQRKMTPSGNYKEKVDCERGWGGWLSPPQIVIRLPIPNIQIVMPTLPVWPAGPSYGDVFYDARQRYCREYQTTGVIDGRNEVLYGTVCLQPDGSWAFNDI